MAVHDVSLQVAEPKRLGHTFAEKNEPIRVVLVVALTVAVRPRRSKKLSRQIR